MFLPRRQPTCRKSKHENFWWELRRKIFNQHIKKVHNSPATCKVAFLLRTDPSSFFASHQYTPPSFLTALLGWWIKMGRKKHFANEYLTLLSSTEKKISWSCKFLISKFSQKWKQQWHLASHSPPCNDPVVLKYCTLNFPAHTRRWGRVGRLKCVYFFN